MKALKFILTTDYGLFSIVGLLLMIVGIGGFFIYLFFFKEDSIEAKNYQEKAERLAE